MIFVISGSQKFQFNRLFKEIDRLCKNGVINDTVIAQMGSSTYIPDNYQYEFFMNFDKFNKYISEAEVIITHGGVGAIFNCLRAGKKVIAVPRLKRFNEAVSDHQIEIIAEFSKMNLIIGVDDVDQIENAIINLNSIKTTTLIHNTHKIINIIEEFLAQNQ